MTPETIKEVLINPDTIIRLATELKNERAARAQLEVTNSELVVQNRIMEHKSNYFDFPIDRGLNLSLRDTAKQIGVKEGLFIRFLLEKKYLFRTKKGRLTPYAPYDNDLFVVKECMNEKTGWTGIQTLVTPKGRETFCLLMLGMTA